MYKIDLTRNQKYEIKKRIAHVTRKALVELLMWHPSADKKVPKISRSTQYSNKNIEMLEPT